MTREQTAQFLEDSIFIAERHRARAETYRSLQCHSYAAAQDRLADQWDKLADRYRKILTGEFSIEVKA